MKVILEIEDCMAMHLMEVLKSLPYVKAKTISTEKAEIISNLKQAIDEVNLIKAGVLEGIDANNLLNEL